MTLISTIEADLEAAWGVIATDASGVLSDAEKDALVIWEDFRAIVTAVLPTEYSSLKVFILQALKDVTDGDLADIETAVLNLAKDSEAWILQIGSATLQAIIAVVKAAPGVIGVIAVI
jgi:hypothetical protein